MKLHFKNINKYIEKYFNRWGKKVTALMILSDTFFTYKDYDITILELSIMDVFSKNPFEPNKNTALGYFQT